MNVNTTQPTIPNGVSAGQPHNLVSDAERRRHAGHDELQQQRQVPRNVGTRERAISVLSGSALTLLGLTGRFSFARRLLGLVGIGLLERGIRGRCRVYGALGIDRSDRGREGVLVERVITIGRPPEQVYRFFRELQNLPRFMQHLEAVIPQGDRRSHWIAKAPAGMSVEWDAEIVDEQEGRLLVWRSVEGSDIENEGIVRFGRAPGDRGTEVRVLLKYDPPLGTLGRYIAKLFGEEPELQLDDDLLHLKEILETGEVPTTEGQPTGRGLAKQRRRS